MIHKYVDVNDVERLIRECPGLVFGVAHDWLLSHLPEIPAAKVYQIGHLLSDPLRADGTFFDYFADVEINEMLWKAYEKGKREGAANAPSEEMTRDKVDDYCRDHGLIAMDVSMSLMLVSAWIEKMKAEGYPIAKELRDEDDD